MDSISEALKQKVIDIRARRSQDAEHFFVIPGTAHNPPYFVKYDGNGDTLFAEARTQNYLHTLSKVDSEAPARVPQVLHTFSFDWTTYIIMEYIPPPAVTLDVWVDNAPSEEERQIRTETGISKVAAIVSWIHSCPLPDGAGIGPVGGGVSQYIFFPDHEAPKLASIVALERYINAALSALPPRVGKPARTTSLADCPLQFCHSDIKRRNFMIRPDTLEVWLIDAQHISILPSPFASYALHGPRDKFIRSVAEKLGLKRWHHLRYMSYAAFRLQHSGDSTFGLDENGLPVTRS
ncbi:hypothetical protein BD410DRAFT_363626 [Rickenella mellea]|uniref:Aminoglycoside phosphotransferase domain-containing protein n=1 Tax=Rickenella mellea TaxID=50990 RepID=A0A4Y7Q038_9AGAM|nr:hypothetical protein BD410DRAFT_363626 [Rickenella mellea]